MQLKILGLQGSKNIDLITSAIKGMSEAEVAATLVKTGLSSEEQIQILTKRGLLETEAEQFLSIAANTTATKTATKATASLGSAIKGIVKTPIGTITAIITALSLVYTIAKKVDEHFGISLKSSANKLSELKSESLELESELSSLNNELDTTSEKIKELEQKGTLSFTEKEELDNLKAQNAELERSIALLNLEAEAKNAEKNERFVSTMKKDMDKSSEYTYYNGAIIDQGLYSSSIAFGAENVGGATEKQYIQQQIDAYKDYLSQIAQLDEDHANDLTNETYNTQREALKKQADDIYDYLFEVNTRFAEYSDGISYITNPTTQEGRAVNEYLDYIRDFQNKLLVLSGNKSEVFNSLTEGAFSNAVSDLKELGKQGGVTVAELQSDKYEDFIDNLIEIGFISDRSTSSLEDVALAFNRVEEASEGAINAIASDPIEGAFENWENAQGKVQSGVKFDTLLEALDLAYDTVSDKTSDVYEKIGNADYKAAIDLLIPVDAEIDETNLSAVKQRIDSTIKKYLKTDDSGNYTGLDVGKFLNASVAAGIMTKDGDNYSVNKGVTLESWAKELGLTMASVKAIMGELEEYGADFQLFDFDDDFETLAKNAKNAAVSLRSTLGEDFDLDLNFDLDSENVIGDIDSAIGTIEGKLKDKDIDPTTAVNLLKTLEYCVKQKQLLEQPVVMLIDTTQIEDDATRGAIKKLQNFITADNEYELKLKLGYDTTEAKKIVTRRLRT